MRFLQHHPAWHSILVALLILGNLPRLGCVCADGTHLICCQKVIRGVTGQICELFHSGDSDKGCPCCALKRQQQKLAAQGCNGSQDPCECHVTLEGPHWVSSQRVECPVDLMVMAVLPAVVPVVSSTLRVETYVALDSNPPGPVLLSAVLRLNI